MAPTRRTPYALVALGAAALVSSWTPASAWLAIGLGALDVWLCLKARAEAGAMSRPLRVALALALAAILVGLGVAARVAVADRTHAGRSIVDEVPPGERTQALDRAREATRPAREGARKELEAVEPRR